MAALAVPLVLAALVASFHGRRHGDNRDNHGRESKQLLQHDPEFPDGNGADNAILASWSKCRESHRPVTP
jgi:hypothetical protein